MIPHEREPPIRRMVDHWADCPICGTPRSHLSAVRTGVVRRTCDCGVFDVFREEPTPGLIATTLVRVEQWE